MWKEIYHTNKQTNMNNFKYFSDNVINIQSWYYSQLVRNVVSSRKPRLTHYRPCQVCIRLRNDLITMYAKPRAGPCNYWASGILCDKHWGENWHIKHTSSEPSVIMQATYMLACTASEPSVMFLRELATGTTKQLVSVGWRAPLNSWSELADGHH